MELKAKMLMIGDTQVGKTSILSRYCKDDFDYFQTTTIGNMSFEKVIKVDHQRINLSIWDTAGQERYRSMATSQFKGVQIFVLVYDLTDVGTANNLSYWIDAIENHASPDYILYLVGNKVDLMESDETEISEEVQEIMNQNDVTHIFASAKENTNIQQIFQESTELAHKKGIIERYNKSMREDDWTEVNSQPSTSKVNKKRCC